MRKVVELLNDGHHHEALVRLWVSATTRRGPDADLPLNAWEAVAMRDDLARLEHQIRAEEFRTALRSGRGVELRRVEVDPLALVVALDRFLDEDVSSRTSAALPYRIGRREYWLVHLKLGRAREAAAAHQPNNPQSWFHHHRVIPRVLPSGLRVEVKPSRDVIDDDLRALATSGRLRAFLGHFEDRVTLDPPPAHRFFVTGLSDETSRATNVTRAFERAAGGRANVVVLPELTVLPAQRDAIKDHLRRLHKAGTAPILAVPGSFHEVRNGRPVNATELLGGDGRTMFVHEKLRPYGFAEGLAEDIVTANTLRVLTTPIGCIAVLICKDYCDDPGPIRDWDTVAVDWWLVPSMGQQSTVDAHGNRADRIWKIMTRGVTLVANQEIDPTGPIPGFAFGGRRTQVAGRPDRMMGLRHPIADGGDFVDIDVQTGEIYSSSERDQA